MKKIVLQTALLCVIAFTANVSFSQSKEITILAVNDMHASIDRFPKFAALVDSMRAIYPDLLLFSAGDNRTGNPVNDVHPEPSYPMTALMNKTGFNLSCIGNHEFDGKIEALRNVINRAEFRHVCANIHAHDSMRLHIEPYRIFEINGVKIAVLGLIQRDENGLPDAHPDNLKNISFTSTIEAAKQYGWLRYMSDVFILLIHDEYEQSILLANQYPLADVIISGHSHTRIDGTELHNNVLITQAESHLKYITYITLQITDGKITNKKAQLLNVNAASTKNETIQTMVDDFKNSKTLNRVLTQVAADFGNKEEFGSMVTDAIRKETNADIAFQHPGGIRKESLPKGDLTVATVYQIDPFNNEVIMFNLTGKEILRLIETAYLTDNKQAPFVSGISYEIELDKQQQIKKINVKMEDGSPLNLQRTYKVVMNSFMAATCKYEKTDQGHSLFKTTAELTIQYLEKQPSINYQGVKRIKKR